MANPHAVNGGLVEGGIANGEDLDGGGPTASAPLASATHVVGVVIYMVLVGVLAGYSLFALWPHPNPSEKAAPPAAVGHDTAGSASVRPTSAATAPSRSGHTLPSPVPAAPTGSTLPGDRVTLARAPGSTVPAEDGRNGLLLAALVRGDEQPTAPITAAPAAAAPSPVIDSCALPPRDPRDPARVDTTRVTVCYLGRPFHMWTEGQLLLLVMLAGALGAMVHGVASFYWYIGNGKLLRSWLPMYYCLPWNGAGIATIFYLIIRGGFFNSMQTVQAASTYSFIALAALVGLFNRQAMEKMKRIAESVFEPAPKGEDQRAPHVTGVSPQSITAGAKSQQLTVSGTGFVRESAVKVGGTLYATTYQNPSTLTVTLDDAQLATPGALGVWVVNPAASGGTSTDAVSLRVTAAKAGGVAPSGGSPDDDHAGRDTGERGEDAGGPAASPAPGLGDDALAPLG